VWFRGLVQRLVVRYAGEDHFPLHGRHWIAHALHASAAAAVVLERSVGVLFADPARRR